MISKEQKEQIVAQYGRTAGDTGSPEVQIAILTARINDLTDHFKATPKTLTTAETATSKSIPKKLPAKTLQMITFHRYQAF